MYGEKRQEVTVKCGVCMEPHTFSVDLEDVANAIADRTKMIHEWCADRERKTYLTPEQCELLISNTCWKCWQVLCPEDEKAYN
jgi:hypothetical protein